MLEFYFMIWDALLYKRNLHSVSVYLKRFNHHI